MKFKIGDLVRFVDEPIEGHITSFQNNDIVGVTDDTGFEIPVPMDKITLVYGNMRRADDEEVVAQNPTVLPDRFVDKGIILSISGEHKDGLAKLHIINETSFELLVSIAEINGAKVKGIFADKISPFDFMQFYSANFANVGKWPSFRIQIIRHYPLAQNVYEPIVLEQRIKPLDLTNQKQRNETLDEKIWFYELDKPQENIGLDKLVNQFVPHRPKRK